MQFDYAKKGAIVFYDLFRDEEGKFVHALITNVCGPHHNRRDSTDCEELFALEKRRFEADQLDELNAIREDFQSRGVSWLVRDRTAS
jgi:hypothetical protein